MKINMKKKNKDTIIIMIQQIQENKKRTRKEKAREDIYFPKRQTKNNLENNILVHTII